MVVPVKLENVGSTKKNRNHLVILEPTNCQTSKAVHIEPESFVKVITSSIQQLDSARSDTSDGSIPAITETIDITLKIGFTFTLFFFVIMNNGAYRIRMYNRRV